MREFFKRFTKGLLIGFGMIIPGVSGGTVAIILNEFEPLLDAISNFHKHIKTSVKFFLQLIPGVFLGVFLLSGVINVFCLNYPTLSKYIFLMTSILGLSAFVIKNKSRFLTRKSTLWIFVGFIISLIISLVLSYIRINDQNAGLIMLFLYGVPLALALILPAISFSYMLLFFGLYEKTLAAISSFEINFLASLFFGIFIGTVCFSKILYKLINKYPDKTYSVVLGFAICSLKDIIL